MEPIIVKPNDKALKKYVQTLDELAQLRVVTEGNTRRAFGTLLTDLTKWTLVEELTTARNQGVIRYDGVLVDAQGIPHGYWEAKDGKDDLEAEIEKKRQLGYNFHNMIVEDTRTAVLFQKEREVKRVAVRDVGALASLLELFLNYDASVFQNFEQATTYFQEKIPDIAQGLKERIATAHHSNLAFEKAYAVFFELCRTSLNPSITQKAVDDMLVQHILTERLIQELFSSEFTRRNVIAREIENVIDKLTNFDRVVFLGELGNYYRVVKDVVAKFDSYPKKQQFINTIYERFFQGYSKKDADKYGIVYTPMAIVDFMCSAVEDVLANEFHVKLGQAGVTVLDPATGTGTFVLDLLKRVDAKYLDDFYNTRLFANEIMLLPYYLASLNIEHAYQERAQRYRQFAGLCLVDTLDMPTGNEKQATFAFMNEENTARITAESVAKVNVIIGNPPYYVGQKNENENNQSRNYPNGVDQRIKETYIKDSQSQKFKLDAYLRFFRWAVDRLRGEDGIVCYVTNNGFVDNYSLNGFRKHLLQDFTHVYHLDLHGDVRQNTKLSGTKHNVFGIQVGVGITIAIRNRKKHLTSIAPLGTFFYYRVDDYATAKEKIAFIQQHTQKGNTLTHIPWRVLQPDGQHNWFGGDVDAWQTYMPIASKVGKASKQEPQTLFRTYSLGVSTNRDALVYDFSDTRLTEKVSQFIEHYNLEIDRYKRSDKSRHINDFVDYSKIKWSATLKSHLQQLAYAQVLSNRVALYRPFTKLYLQYNPAIIDRPSLFKTLLPAPDSENKVICLSGVGSNKPFQVLVTNQIPSLDLLEKTQCFPFYVYNEDGTNRRENITDWALSQFQTHYQDPTITKWDIFYYVYGALHQPAYRTRFAQELKKELPRVPYLGAKSNRTPPLAPTPPSGEGDKNPAEKSHSSMQWGQGDLGDGGSSAQWRQGDLGDGGSSAQWRQGDLGDGGFHTYARLGKQLAELHLNYETAKKYDLTWLTPKGAIDYRVSKMKRVGNTIHYNDSLILADIPPQAWEYKLGNRSALEWVIDQYQHKTDQESGIIQDPNQASPNEKYVVELLERVTYISVQSMTLIAQLPHELA
jgi:predicted helicase